MKKTHFSENDRQNDSPIPSRTVVSLTSASFAVENDLRNRNDAFLLIFTMGIPSYSHNSSKFINFVVANRNI